jgi:hypothetical protein
VVGEGVVVGGLVVDGGELVVDGGELVVDTGELVVPMVPSVSFAGAV